MNDGPLTQKFAFHGLPVVVSCDIPSIQREVRRVLGPSAVSAWPSGFVPVAGTIVPFDAADVMRHVTSTATHYSDIDQLAEIYRDQDHYWLVDDRWGICELNMLRPQWRSWILPRPIVDPVHCAEMAVLWPMAQLLRARSLNLIPAASASLGKWGVLIISPYGIEPELAAMAHAGYRIIGQRWTALREEEDGRLTLLHVPGRVERFAPPHLRTIGEAPAASWVDLTEGQPWAAGTDAFCDAVIIVDPGRRPRPSIKPLQPGPTNDLLRRFWPMIDLEPDRRASGLLPARMARRCSGARVQLSIRNPREILTLLDELRRQPRPRSTSITGLVTVSLPPKKTATTMLAPATNGPALAKTKAASKSPRKQAV